MNIYMGYVEDPREGAVLIFACSVREAKLLAWPILRSWFQVDYIDVSVRLVKDSEYLYAEADQEKLALDKPHVIESPRTCEDCKLWGVSELNEEGYCNDCQDEREADSPALPADGEGKEQSPNLTESEGRKEK